MYNIKFSIDKKDAIFIVKKAVLFRYTIVKDDGDSIVVGTPPSFLTTVTIKAQSIEFQGNIAISNSCSAAIKRELAKFEAKQNKKKAAPKKQEKAEDVKDAAVAERMELAVLLEKYKQLLDNGAISQEDYDKRKDEILAMMEFEKKEEEQPKIEEAVAQPVEEPAPQIIEAEPEEKKEEPAPVQQQPQQPVIQIINNAPAQAPVQEQPKKEKCAKGYKIACALLSVLVLAAAATAFVLYFIIAKMSTVAADGVKGANGLGLLLASKLPLSTQLAFELIKGQFTLNSLLAGGITCVVALIVVIMSLISMKPRHNIKLFINALGLLFGIGALVFQFIAGPIVILFTVAGGLTILESLVLLVLSFLRPKK